MPSADFRLVTSRADDTRQAPIWNEVGTMNPEAVTMVRNAIHNPTEPRHFMRVVPAGNQRTATVGGHPVATSADALIVKEVGFDLYDHVVYFPRDAVADGVLSSIDKSTHCPLKGNTEYFDLVVDGETIAEAAWSYIDTIPEAEILHGYVAFDTSKVDVA